MYHRMLSILRWILKKNNLNGDSPYSYEEEMSFLMGFNNPKDDFERSFYQYQCYKKITGAKTSMVIISILSFLAFLPTLIILLIKGLFTRYDHKIEVAMTQDFISDNRLIIDSDVKYTFINYMRGSLKLRDIYYVYKSILYGKTDFNYSMKILLRIADYSKIICEYSPDIVYCSAEYSYTSSVLTKYCEDHGIKHINLMHGEKIFNIREAFSRFSEFYVWDSYYISLFQSLRCEKTKYFVSPPSFTKVENACSKTNICTYYLQEHSIDQLKKIREELIKTKLDFRVRPHPIYAENVEEVFNANEIEDSFRVDIWDSLANAGIVISMNSTVLFQAYLNNIPTCIDDITDHLKYEDLKKRGYIMNDKATYRLSKLIN